MSTLISAMIVHAVFRSTPWDAHQTLNLFFKGAVTLRSISCASASACLGPYPVNAHKI